MDDRHPDYPYWVGEVQVIAPNAPGVLGTLGVHPAVQDWRREAVRKLATAADSAGWCSDFEQAIQLLGLEDAYELPKILVEVPVPFTMARKFNPRDITVSDATEWLRNNGGARIVTPER